MKNHAIIDFINSIFTEKNKASKPRSDNCTYLFPSEMQECAFTTCNVSKMEKKNREGILLPGFFSINTHQEIM